MTIQVDIGVDPGWKSGGYTICVDGKPKNMVAYNLNDIGDFLEHLHEYKDLSRRIILEDIPFFTGRNIPGSAGVKLGYSAGMIEGIALGERIPCYKVKPTTWMKGLSGLKGKSSAERKRTLRGHATRLYPQLSPTLRTADAILLTHHFITNKS